jgi:hypothetical protein
MGNDNMDKLDKIENNSIMSETVDVYAFAPQLSYMSEQMVAADPAFWTLKPMAAPAPASKGKKK